MIADKRGIGASVDVRAHVDLQVLTARIGRLDQSSIPGERRVLTPCGTILGASDEELADQREIEGLGLEGRKRAVANKLRKRQSVDHKIFSSRLFQVLTTSLAGRRS